MTERRTIAMEQCGKNGKEIWVIDMECPIQPEYSMLQCSPLVNGQWEYTKSKIKFVPTGRR